MARKPVLGIGLCLLAAAMTGCHSTTPGKQNPTPTSWNNTPQNKQKPGGALMPATVNGPQDMGRFPMATGGNPTPLPTPPSSLPGIQPVNATPASFGSPSSSPGLNSAAPSGNSPVAMPEAPRGTSPGGQTPVLEAPRNNSSPTPGGPDLVIPPAPPAPPGYNPNVPGLN